MKTWVIVLIKDFDSAKQRLRPALGTRPRRALARRNALLAVRAATAGEHVLVVAGGEEVSEVPAAWGADVLLEPGEEGRNVAAERGLGRAVAQGADAVLLLSSALPLVTHDAVRDLLRAAGRLQPPVAVAVPAIGRGGTHALYPPPPQALGMHLRGDYLAELCDGAATKRGGVVIHDPV